MKNAIVVLLVLALPVVMSGDGKKKKDPPQAAGQASSTSSSDAKKEEPAKEKAPPSLAKAVKLPPGLQKKFGSSRPEGAAFVAFDPKNTDRAWFLVDGAWKLEEGFDAGVVSEVKASLALPKAAPPVPLPDVGVALQVVKFD